MDTSMPIAFRFCWTSCARSGHGAWLHVYMTALPVFPPISSFAFSTSGPASGNRLASSYEGRPGGRYWSVGSPE